MTTSDMGPARTSLTPMRGNGDVLSPVRDSNTTALRQIYCRKSDHLAGPLNDPRYRFSERNTSFMISPNEVSDPESPMRQSSTPSSASLFSPIDDLAATLSDLSVPDNSPLVLRQKPRYDRVLHLDDTSSQYSSPRHSSVDSLQQNSFDFRFIREMNRLLDELSLSKKAITENLDDYLFYFSRFWSSLNSAMAEFDFTRPLPQICQNKIPVCSDRFRHSWVVTMIVPFITMTDHQIMAQHHCFVEACDLVSKLDLNCSSDADFSEVCLEAFWDGLADGLACKSRQVSQAAVKALTELLVNVEMSHSVVFKVIMLRSITLQYAFSNMLRFRKHRVKLIMLLTDRLMTLSNPGTRSNHQASNLLETCARELRNTQASETDFNLRAEIESYLQHIDRVRNSIAPRTLPQMQSHESSLRKSFAVASKSLFFPTNLKREIGRVSSGVSHDLPMEIPTGFQVINRIDEDELSTCETLNTEPATITRPLSVLSGSVRAQRKRSIAKRFVKYHLRSIGWKLSAIFGRASNLNRAMVISGRDAGYSETSSVLSNMSSSLARATDFAQPTVDTSRVRPGAPNMRTPEDRVDSRISSLNLDSTLAGGKISYTENSARPVSLRTI